MIDSFVRYLILDWMVCWSIGYRRIPTEISDGSTIAMNHNAFNKSRAQRCNRNWFIYI